MIRYRTQVRILNQILSTSIGPTFYNRVVFFLYSCEILARPTFYNRVVIFGKALEKKLWDIMIGR